MSAYDALGGSSQNGRFNNNHHGTSVPEAAVHTGPLMDTAWLWPSRAGYSLGPPSRAFRPEMSEHDVHIGRSLEVRCSIRRRKLPAPAVSSFPICYTVLVKKFGQRARKP